MEKEKFAKTELRFKKISHLSIPKKQNATSYFLQFIVNKSIKQNAGTYFSIFDDSENEDRFAIYFHRDPMYTLTFEAEEFINRSITKEKSI